MCSNILLTVVFNFLLENVVLSLKKYANCIIRFSQICNKYYLYNKSIKEWFEVLKCCICWPSYSFVEIFLLYPINDLFGICFKIYLQFDLQKNHQPLEVSNFLRLTQTQKVVYLFFKIWKSYSYNILQGLLNLQRYKKSQQKPEDLIDFIKIYICQTQAKPLAALKKIVIIK